MPLSELFTAAADGFADNPDAAAYAVVRGYCDRGSLYYLAAENLRTGKPQADHEYGNARHAHEFVALVAEYAELAAAGLRADSRLLAGDYDYLLAKHTALTAKHDFLNAEYTSADHYAAAAYSFATTSGGVYAYSLAAESAAELAAEQAAEATIQAISGASHLAARAAELAEYAAEQAALAAEYAAEQAAVGAEYAALAAEYAPEPESRYIIRSANTGAKHSAAYAEHAELYAEHAADWASSAASGR